MTIIEIVQIGSMVLLTVTLLITVLTYRRNKRGELQNHLYKNKLEAFANIVYEIEQFSIQGDRSKQILQKLSDQSQVTLTEENLAELANDIDEELYKCNALIVKNSVYFSAVSTEMFLKFTANLFERAPDQSIENVEIFLNQFYTKQLDLANEAVEKVREELGLEKLNMSLFKRVR